MPITRQAMRSDAPAISSERRTPNGVSIIAITGLSPPPAASSREIASPRSRALSMRGNRMAWAELFATAARSSANQGEPRRLTLTTTSRLP
ncbi:MAG: hypothetical protein WDN04_17715 [Rhodospirillales bacterium]